MEKELVLDNLDPSAPEVSDICAWQHGMFFNPDRKVYVQGSSLFDRSRNLCYSG
jgi:hypothetical protein